MSRADEFKSNTNPALKYVSWKSNDKTFEAYDKESKTKELCKLPFEFTLLKVGSSVKGWNDAEESPIYSNIITNTIKQDLNVRCGSNVIARGKYTEIKDKIIASGAHFETNIFALYNGEIVMINLKGAALGKWFDFARQHRGKFLTEKIVIDGFEEGKKGAVKFNTPVFKLLGVLTLAQANEANECYDVVADFLELPPEEEINEIEMDEHDVVSGAPDTDDNDLPF